MNSSAAIWDERGRAHKSTLKGVLFERMPDALNEALNQWHQRAVLDGLKGARVNTVLDLGCGWGRIAQAIVRHYPRARMIGVDIAPSYVKLFAKNIPRSKALVGSLTALPVPDHSCDVVVSVTALMYVKGPQLGQAFAEIARVLRPDGRLVCVENTARGWRFAMLGGLLPWLAARRAAQKTPQTPNRLFTSGELEHAARRKKFYLLRRRAAAGLTAAFPLVLGAAFFSKTLARALWSVGGFADPLLRALHLPGLYELTVFERTSNRAPAQ